MHLGFMHRDFARDWSRRARSRRWVWSYACAGELRSAIPLFVVLAGLMLSAPFGTVALAATKLPEIDAALAAQVSDQVHKEWNPDAELIQVTATTTADGSADGNRSGTPISFFF